MKIFKDSKFLYSKNRKGQKIWAKIKKGKYSFVNVQWKSQFLHEYLRGCDKKRLKFLTTLAS